MQTTTNLGLKKPETNEFVNISDLNENADMIDLAIGKMKPLDVDMTVYVATTGSNTAGDGTSENPYETITYALSKIPKVLNGFTASIIVSAGTYNEDVQIEGFTGKIEILLAGNVTVNGFNVIRSTVTCRSSNTTARLLSVIYINVDSGRLDSFSNISINTTGFLTDAPYTSRNSSIFVSRGELYLAGVVNLLGNTDIGVAVATVSNAFIGTLIGDSLTIGKYIATGSQLTCAKTNVSSSQPDFTNAGVRVSPYGAVIGTLTSDITLYVSPSGSDETGTGTSVNPLKTIQRAINMVPKDLGSFVCTINVASGTYNEDVYIRGFHNGSINLYSEKQNTLSTSCNVLSIMVGHCTGYVRINGFNLISTTKVPITVFSTDGAYIYYCQCTFPTSGINGINCYESKVGVEYCKMTGKDTALMASFSTVISNNWYSSGGNNYGIYSLNGSRITMNGSQPSGINENTILGNGGMFVNNNGTQISGLITSGLSCTWGTLTGGYVRHGNANGVAMITINIRVATTSVLSAGTTYFIYGFPATDPVSIAVACQVEGHFSHRALTTIGRMDLTVTSTINIPAGNIYQFSATYLANS